MQLESRLPVDGLRRRKNVGQLLTTFNSVFLQDYIVELLVGNQVHPAEHLRICGMANECARAAPFREAASLVGKIRLILWQHVSLARQRTTTAPAARIG